MKINKLLLIAVISFTFLVLGLSVVSAELCKGDDGYYHDCSTYKSTSKTSTKYCSGDSCDSNNKNEYDSRGPLYNAFYDTYDYIEQKNSEYYDKGLGIGYEAGVYRGLYDGLKEGLDKGYDYGVDAGKYEGLKEGIEELDTWYDKGYDAGKEASDSNNQVKYYISYKSKGWYDYYYKPVYDYTFGHFRW